ncbi:Signal transduction histidine kinase [Methylophaga sulfidovorans]|uniref:histidine kinase n=1 Tax=Methylophaga sulfidovorans TaxID=45496 RepID=A0A1I3VGF5_9GAMM|nr:Signal transduction histidine kinase [Methylophaga sulfidovorans]
MVLYGYFYPVCFLLALIWLSTTSYVLPLSRLFRQVSGESDSSVPSSGNAFEILRQNFTKLNADKQALTEQKQQLEIDLSERDKVLSDAINRLARPDDAKSGMISVISRELKTPLSRVISYIELLKVHITEAKSNEAISLINDSMHHLLDVVNQLQDYAKLSENQLTLEVEQVDLYRFLKSVVEVNYAKARQKKNILSLNMTCSGMEVMLDPHKLRNVLNNLIDNAIKFTEQGDIELSVSEFSKDKQHFLTLTVSDSATVINDDEKERIFEPFQQSSLNDQQQYPGLGLGLTIYAYLVQLMHGEHGVKTSTQGNSFWFTIPVDIVSVTSTLPEEVVQSNSSIDEKKVNHVLVAEDNEVNQSVALGLLEKLGCTVTLVANGEEAITSCSEQNYDMIFMDYHMPLMNGVMATDHLRKVLQITTPIIALTADANEQVKLDFYAAGADDILIKPIELNKLIDLVNKFLGKAIEPGSGSYNNKEVSELNPTLNMEIVDGIGENGDEIVQQIFQVYMQHTPDLIQAIKQAFIEESAEQLFKSAHALKSSSLNIGATAIAELAREIEQLGRENNLDQIDTYIDKLDTYYDELTSLLNGQWRRI